MSSESPQTTVQREDPVKNVGQFHKHIAYWFDDGSVVIRVDGTTIYKIHLSLLNKLSDPIRQILSIPDGKAPGDPTREGTELYPLYLPYTNTQEFNDFLLWLYRSEWDFLGNSEEKERICIHLLKLSDMWQIEAGKKFAIKTLQDMVLPPSQRLELAGKYNINDWVDPAVREIFDHKVADITNADICAMGWMVYSKLVKAKEKLEEETRRTAMVAPAIAKDPSWECQNHNSCQSVWPKVWFDKIGKKLLHPTMLMKLSQIRAEVEKEETLKHAGLTERCRMDMVAQIRDNIVFPDEQIIPACVASVIKVYKEL
ncbi:hypothetical protein FB451DRAFT_1509776 [Mycena latifolia]|nr:hypothetical protein FB451DRAFT_1509776 [Mycena latifolia]